MSRHITIPIFVPHKGCPFDCIYCNQKNISGQQKAPTLFEVEQTIEKHLKSISTGSDVEIGFFGGSFTGIERDYQLALLNAAYKYVKAGWVNAIRLSTRPDYIDSEIIHYLMSYDVKTIELGVQSFDEEVLKNSCRGHTSQDVYKASELILQNGLNLVIQTMVGLPGDNKNKALETAKKVVKIGPQAVRIYPTLVIKDTYLETLYRKEKYRALTLEEAVDQCTDLLEIYRNNNITVIRLGLQATANISEEGDVVAGPFHPAFGQLVESRLMLKKIEDKLAGVFLPLKSSLIVIANERDISNVVGQKKCNINYLKSKYKFASIKVKPGRPENNSLDVEIY